ncbi:MAG: S9 family peptidase [Bacteroidota bacterium]
MTRLLALLTLFLVPLAAAQTPRPMTTDDGLGLVRASGVTLSPDGQHVFFGRRTLNWGENTYETTYHLMPADSGLAFPYIGEDGGSGFAYAPSGLYLAFRRSVGSSEKTQQLFVMSTAGGEAVQLTKHPTSVGAFRWAADGSTIFFVADEPLPDDEKKERKNGADAIFVDEGPNGQTRDQWSNLWQVDVALADEPAEATRLTSGDRLVGAFDVDPQATRVVFMARTENRRNQGNRSEIFLLTLADTSVTPLTDNAAPESGLLWAPDGQSFAYRAAHGETWELYNSKIWVMDPDTRERRMISGAFEGNIRTAVWTPDSQAMLFGGLQRTNTNLYRLEVATGALTQLTDVTGTLNPLAFSRDATRMVYSYENLHTPPDLYTSPTDALQPTRLTRLNPSIAPDSLLLAEAEVIQWASYDGLEIEGLMVKPVGYEEGTQVPLMLHIHGGPAGVFTNSFRPQYQVWAGLGYAQLMPNVRGSSGYSDDLLRGNMFDIGEGDYDDLMSGVDRLIADGLVDADRMGVRGWSYGGILGGRTITKTNRFKGASLGAGVFDWTSEYGPGFNFDVRLFYIGGTPWENPEAYREKSTLTHVADIETPTLILHGMADRVDTEPQSMMLFAALKDQGKPVRYIRFPREPHGFREPRHQRTRDVEEIRWMQQYVLGEDWAPWARPEMKKDDADEAAPATASD